MELVFHARGEHAKLSVPMSVTMEKLVVMDIANVGNVVRTTAIPVGTRYTSTVQLTTIVRGDRVCRVRRTSVGQTGTHLDTIVMVMTKFCVDSTIVVARSKMAEIAVPPVATGVPVNATVVAVLGNHAVLIVVILD